MFTGLIEATSKVCLWESPADKTGITVLGIERPNGFETNLGDSVAVNGCCLTECRGEKDQLFFELSQETLDCTSFQLTKLGQVVNLERAMRLGDRLGGHMVSGHVDGICTIKRIDKQSNGWRVAVSLPRSSAPFVIVKGSICLDGVSLTVNSVQDDKSTCELEVMLIPTTLTKTTLSSLYEGQVLNYELDMIGKYALRQNELNQST